jgi:hypothetical protein
MTTDYPHMQKSLDTITHISADMCGVMNGSLSLGRWSRKSTELWSIHHRCHA